VCNRFELQNCKRSGRRECEFTNNLASTSINIRFELHCTSEIPYRHALGAHFPDESSRRSATGKIGTFRGIFIRKILKKMQGPLFWDMNSGKTDIDHAEKIFIKCIAA
jgi:hypothetical protein